MTQNSITQPLPNFDGLSDVEPMWEARKRTEKAAHYQRMRMQIGMDVRDMLNTIDAISTAQKILNRPRRRTYPTILQGTNSGFTTEPDSPTSLHLRGVPEELDRLYSDVLPALESVDHAS